MSQLPTTQSQSDDPGAVLPPVQTEEDVQHEEPVEQHQTMPTNHALVPNPEAAADADLIEKEWVEKAKQIVASTAEDPFSQQEALTKMKHDYLKKRYNKELGKKII